MSLYFITGPSAEVCAASGATAASPFEGRLLLCREKPPTQTAATTTTAPAAANCFPVAFASPVFVCLQKQAITLSRQAMKVPTI